MTSPNGWIRTPSDRGTELVAELRREVPPGHVLFGVDVEAFADRDGASDDVLFRRLDQPDRFAMVHLTWRGSAEVDASWASIDFEGTLDEFVEHGNKLEP